ncbi:glutamyl-tRNA reductase [Luteitalea sp. TBR-22]|uniref:glutamyl-tRNA reductase n=1 Tax=Luteitalea sp. TBR-22 TaxID=2802971 RepID=UPI001AFA50AB|nr:glutamyl-tRNA reductase [Luteitalea sp. TBR-22]BCS33480.1 glutamyl-tRNA reductase [Luteitalea sp. TBR-22]
MSLVLLGVDFRQAALDLRVALSYDAPAARALLARAREVEGLREAAILSTCNRTEFYLVVDHQDAAARWLQLLRRDRPTARATDPACLLTRHVDAAAAGHLFAVAAGLDSAILGDAHVNGQVKRAYDQAREAGTLGPVLHRAFQQAFAVAKRVRRETALGRGHVSIGGCVAHQLAYAAPLARRVSIIGTGAVATDVARHLAKRGIYDLTIVSKDRGRATELATHVGGRGAVVPQLEDWLADADVVIGATGTSVPVLTSAMLALAGSASSARQGHRPSRLVVCDLGVPRNVDADIEARVFTIDDIRARQDAALTARESAVPAARRLVDAAVEGWTAWHRERALVPAIVGLYARERARREEMAARLWGRAGRAQVHLDARLRRAGRQLLHRQVVALRAKAAGYPGTPGGPAARVTVQG